MKKLVLISFVVGLFSLSSCYKHSVCATYTSNDVKVETTTENN